MLRLGQCHRLKCSTSSEMNDLWAVSSAKHVNIDTVISANGADYNKASTRVRWVKKGHLELKHLQQSVGCYTLHC